MYQICPSSLVQTAKQNAQELGRSLSTVHGGMPNLLEVRGLHASIESAVKAIADMTLRAGVRDISAVGEGHPFLVPTQVFRTAYALDSCLQRLEDPGAPKKFRELVATAEREIRAFMIWEQPRQ